MMVESLLEKAEDVCCTIMKRWLEFGGLKSQRSELGGACQCGGWELETGILDARNDMYTLY